jgi:hypothetical protein
MSMVLDHFEDRWKQHEPWKPPQPVPLPYYPSPYEQGPFEQPVIPNREPPITDEEIREFRDLLKRAREYDKKHKQPDCESEQKMKKLLDLAEQLGVREKVEKALNDT